MPIDFPSSPTQGQLYSYNGVTYVYTAQGVWATAGAAAVANVSQVGFRAHKNGVDQTGYITSVLQKITFTTEDFDRGGYYDAANSRWTPPAGLIHLDVTVYCSAGLTVSGINFLAFYKNGTIVKRSTEIAAAQPFQGFQVSLDDVANGTDYYEVYFNPQTTTTASINGNVEASFFSGHVTGGPPGPVGPSGAVTGAPSAPQGRLTLQTGTPVMTTTQSGKTTIFYTPYVGDRVPIYDGTNMVMTTFAELSVATTDTTKSPAAIGASKVNDWFVWSDSGTLRLGHGPDWTSDTARSAGTALVMVNGIWLNNASITNGPAAQRGTYVGTTRSNASSQLDWIYGGLGVGGVAGVFGVWNAYNRIIVSTRVGDTTDTWTYATVGVWRAANNSSNMRVSFIFGLDKDAIDAYHSTIILATGGALGVGIDAVSAFSGLVNWTNAGITAGSAARFSGNVGVGFHFASAIEYTSAGTSTFYGDGGGPTFLQGGLIVTLRM